MRIYMNTLVCMCVLSGIVRTLSGYEIKHTIDAELVYYELDKCKEPWCEKYSTSDVQKMFPGMFRTEKESNDIHIVYEHDREILLHSEGVNDTDDIMKQEGDGDSCCATQKGAHRNTTMKNLYGDDKIIVHLVSESTPMYQYIPFASCVNKSDSCDGICVLEPITISALIYDPADGLFKFDLFLVPGYCSCKRSFNL